MKKIRKNVYICCEEMDFIWSMKEVLEFDMAWNHKKNQGKNQMEIINELAEYFDRDPDEIGLLAIDRAKKGRI